MDNKIYVIRTPEQLNKFGEKTIYGAPLLFMVCSDADGVWVRKYDDKNMVDIDASIVTDHMMLAATELGLGSCWLTYFDPAAVRSAFQLPDNLIPVNLLAVGYAAEDAKSSDGHSHSRKPLYENVIFL